MCFDSYYDLYQSYSLLCRKYRNSEETVSQTETVVEEDTADANDTTTNDFENKDCLLFSPGNCRYIRCRCCCKPSIVLNHKKVLENTEYIPYAIQEAVGGDLFRIETVRQYPLEQVSFVDMADEEQNRNVCPVLFNTVQNMEQYETVFLNCPNWWRMCRCQFIPCRR